VKNYLLFVPTGDGTLMMVQQEQDNVDCMGKRNSSLVGGSGVLDRIPDRPPRIGAPSKGNDRKPQADRNRQ